MSGGGGLPLIGWGVAVVAIAVFGTLAFGLALLPTLLLAGGGGAAVAVGASLQLRAPRQPRGVSDLSFASVVVAVGLTVVVTGASAGQSEFALPGAAVLALGLVGMVTG